MKDPQQAADELVENIGAIGALNIALFYEEIIQLAILQTQGVIDALSKLILDPFGEVTNADLKIGELMEYNFKVLTHLKTRL